MVCALTLAVSIAAPCFSVVFNPSASGLHAAAPFMLGVVVCGVGLALAIFESVRMDRLERFQPGGACISYHGCKAGAELAPSPM